MGYKGGLIMPGGSNPDRLISAQPFFAAALVTLHSHLGGHNGWLRRASLTIFVGLVLPGLAALRAGALLPRWRVLPLVIGLLVLLPV